MKIDTSYLKENAKAFPKIFYIIFDDGNKGVSTIITFNSKEHIINRVYTRDVPDKEIIDDLRDLIIPKSLRWFDEYQANRFILIKEK